MNFKSQLIPGKLIKRYKRFLADITLEGGTQITAHCPNSGRMTQCQGKDWPAFVSRADNPSRKLKYTWELVHNGECWICVNTHMANEVVFEALKNNQIEELKEYPQIEREKKYSENSRIDFLLSSESEKCYLEVKSVTLTHNGKYTFPDAPTVRGRKHLDDLIKMKHEGHRSVMLFLVMRSDAEGFSPAEAYRPRVCSGFEKGKN